MDVTRYLPGRAYQVARDPERLLIEERPEVLSAAVYPLTDDDSGSRFNHTRRDAWTHAGD